MRLALVLTLLALWPSGARAHDRSISHATVSVRGPEATVQLRLRALDLNALGADRLDAARLGSHLMSSVTLESERGACSADPGSFVSLEDSRGWSRFEWRLRCDTPPVRLRAAPVPARTSHVCFAEVRWTSTGRRAAYVLSELSVAADLRETAEARGPVTGADWVLVGAEHILSGLDHLVFLLMLLLLGGSLRQTAMMVTGFTLGHSLTLAAVALDFVEVNAAPVEAVIGLSIALVAVENVWLSRSERDTRTPAITCSVPLGAAFVTGEPAFAGIALFAACHFALLSKSEEPIAWRWVIASVFGLLHGLGFAGALVDVGLPPGSTVSALFGFNVGVELGQLAVIAIAWPAVAYLSRKDGRRRMAVHLGSAAGVAAGVYWFVTRAFA